jgi:hypothetical protein
VHHLRTFGIEKMEGHKNLHAFTHSSGRYKIKLAEDLNHTAEADQGHSRE